ncbi:MAG: hypothetical protein CMJ89_05025 [Planctomycetes bacterium]|nr:hypothetical protein [Planctomycetota bacterium]
MKGPGRSYVAFAFLCSALAFGQEDLLQEDEQSVSFQRDVLPILRSSCQGCHQPAKAQGHVVLLNHGDLLLAVDGGEPCIVPGSPDASVLVDVITPLGDVPPEMPEDGPPLSEDQVELIRRWIAAGAPDDTPSSLRADPSGPPVYDRPPVVSSLDFSPTGEVLAVSGRGEVLLHRGDGGAIVERLVGLSERIESVAFSPDGMRLAVVGGSPSRVGELQVWDVQEKKLLLSKPVTFDTLQGVSWSPDGTKLAFGCKDNTLRAIDAASGVEILYQGAHADWVLGTSFSSDASHLVSVGRDRSMKLVRVATQQFIDNITSITPGALKGGLLSVARHPNRDELLVGGADGAPKIFRMYREEKRVIGDDSNLIRAFDALPGRVFSVDWSPSGDWVVAGSSLHGSGEVRAYRVEDGEALWSVTFDSGIYAVDVHPGGQRIAAAGFEGVVHLLDAADGHIVRDFLSVPLRSEDGAASEAVEASLPHQEDV